MLYLALAVAWGSAGPLYPRPSQRISNPSTSLDSAQGVPFEAYTPGPDLSPSTRLLTFSDMLPGESRTLFMDLANLGEGLIIIDSIAYARELLQVSLPLQSLRPGQFVRFPVTFSQTGLDTQHHQLNIHWRSPKFGLAGTMPLELVATPRTPLVADPAHIQWKRGYVGARHSFRLLLQNLGPQAIVFPETPASPPEVLLQLPQFLGGESSVAVQVVWRPTQPGPLGAQLKIPFMVDGIQGWLAVDLAGHAVQPALFAEDTLDFGHVYAGSSYKRGIEVDNGSEHTTILKRRAPLLSEGLPAAAVEKAGWVVTPDEFVLPPGKRLVVDVNFFPRWAGTYLARIPFDQHLSSSSGQAPESLPDLVLTVQAAVALPLEVSADQVDFGPQPVLETSIRSLDAVNRGAAPLSMSVNLAMPDPAFSFPPLVFNLPAGDRLSIPLYFRPVEMKAYANAALLEYQTFGEPQELRVAMSGMGLDRPLLQLEKIQDVTLAEDFEGWVHLADLATVFADANHAVSYRLSHPFRDALRLKESDGQLMVATTANFHGAGRVVVQAVNELGHAMADSFNLSIAPSNDLPRRGKPLPDLVFREDTPDIVVGRLSDVFVDPDRALDTVKTFYTIYSPAKDAAVRLSKVGDELILSVRPNWYGNRSFVVSAKDAADTSVVVFDAFKVTILPENDPPLLDTLPELRLAEDEISTVSWRSYIQDIDDSAAALQLRFTAANGGSLPVAFEIVPGLATVVRPHPDWFGQTRVILTVTDPSGTSASRQFSVFVSSENDPPGPFSLLGPVTTEWDQRLRYAGVDTLITFAWEPSPDRDPGDDLFYTWQLLDSTRQRVIKEQPAGPATSVTAYLDSSGIFFWTVIVRDSEGAEARADTLLVILESLDASQSAGEGQLSFSLGPNYPNPFSDRTSIAYTIPRYSEVALIVYDAMGRKVRNLRDAPQYRGRYLAEWDGRDNQGLRVASGPYVAELRAGTVTAYLKLVVVH